MSIGGSTSGIRFSGLASGIDVDSIVTQMIQIEGIGIQRLQAQQAQLSARQSIYGQFKSKLIGLNSSLSRLNVSSAYTPVTVSSSDDTIAKATADSTAVSGTYNIDVQQLAKAHKVTSSAMANSTDALSLSGDFMINGKQVSVGSGDSLADVASKINALGNGVTASLLNGGTGNTFLVLTSQKTGADNAVQVSNLNGTALAGLGLVSGIATTRDTSGEANTARSLGFSSSSTVVSDLTGSSKSGSIFIGSGPTLVNIDFATDSLDAIASKINLAGEPGVEARVITKETDGTTTHHLEIYGSGVPADVVDNDGLLEGLGVFQRGFSNQLVAAQDSRAVVDNITVTSSKNTITGVVQGLTINLTKVGTTEINLNRDVAKIQDSIKSIQSGFNDVIDYIRQNSTFDDKTFQSGALFGDQTASQVEQTLNELLFSNLGTGNFKNLTDLGFSLDESGKLALDESKLTNALSTDLEGVKSLMMATGSSANADLKFVSAGSKAVASNAIGYPIEITQAATKTLGLAGTAKTLDNVAGETLTFSGILFNNKTVDLAIDTNSSLADIITKINSDTRLNKQIVASDNGGTLQIESKRYGAAGVFSVVSNLAAAADTSGIGTTGATITAGLDVAGTINGEAATGNGLFLLGNEGNSTTSGLQIQYSGASTGNVGNFVFNRGLSSLMSYRLNSFTDSVDGLLSTVDKSISGQIEDIGSRITSIQERLTLREAVLRQRFAAMEQAISVLSSQGSQLSSMLAGLQ